MHLLLKVFSYICKIYKKIINSELKYIILDIYVKII